MRIRIKKSTGVTEGECYTMKNATMDAKRMVNRYGSLRTMLVVEGLLVGVFAGLVTSLYRYLLDRADDIRNAAIGFCSGSPLRMLGWFGALAVMAVVVTLLLKWEPMISGSGIPQVEAELLGKKDMNWLSVLVSKILGCALSIGGGLALGREGPSIQIGAMVGKGFARTNKRVLTEERYLMSCGAGAGLSAAFGAPLAGTIFCLEELYRNFSSEVLLSTMAAAASSDFVAAYIIGMEPVFGFRIEYRLPLKYYWFAMILGVVLGLFGSLYNRTIDRMQDFFDRVGTAANALAKKWPGRRRLNPKTGKMDYKGNIAPFAKLAVGLTMAYICFFAYPITLGSGNGLVSRIAEGDLALKALLILLAVKFVFSTASFGTTAPGGIFLPLLVLGAVTGGVYSRLLENLLGIDGKYIAAFVVLAMAGYFAAIVHAPVTGVVLITEMTGDFRSLLGLVMVSLIAFVISERLGTEPIYTQLMNRSSGKRYNVPKQRKSIIDDIVHPGSIMDGKRIMDMGLPLGALIVSVIREEQEFIPDGHTILRGGDVIEVLLREEDLAEVEHIIEEECKKVRL